MPVNTVHGPIDGSQLGQTLIHEHIVTADWSMRMAFGEHYYEHDVIVDRAVAQFLRAKQSGVRTVVDGTPVNMGRDIGLIREVAERTGLEFIVSSGFYYQEEVFLNWRSEGEIHAWLSRECEEGVSGTGVRPGIMKAACAVDGITPTLDRVFRAIGRVAAEQRLPIFCHHHIEVGNGEAILDLFEDCGVTPSQVVLGHSGDTNDLGYLEKMLRRGCYLGMDRFGHCAAGNSLADRVGTIVELCARGYGDRLLLSHDLATYFGVFGSWQDFKAEESAEPAVDFTFINRQVVPALESAGLASEAVRAMLERNPAEFLEVD
ncbi:phosphotriesterase [Rhodococcus sp. PAM 2766]|uniref:Phosphotriesterase n=1 Tax=Rhodococcus parequi TaxID=3137122 RepID=A0ABW9FG90_9NOCA